MMFKRYSDPLFVQNYIQACNVVYLDYYGRSRVKSGCKKIVSPIHVRCHRATTEESSLHIVWLGSNDQLHQMRTSRMIVNVPITHEYAFNLSSPHHIHCGKPVCETPKRFQRFKWSPRINNRLFQNYLMDFYDNYMKPAMLYNYYTYTRPLSPIIDHAISLYNQDKNICKLSINDIICKDINVLIKHLCCFE